MSLLAGIRTLADLPLEGRRVLVRADLDAPVSGDEVTDDARIRAALPTIHTLLDAGAKVIVAAHLAPRSRERAPSLEPIGASLSGLSGREVHLPEDCIGDAPKKVVQDLRPGQICLLENLAFHREEEDDDPAFAEKLAELTDVYVNDALLASAEKRASVHALPRVVRERAAGIALETELRALDRAVEPTERPYVAILGGSSLDVALFTALVARADVLCIGGGVANTLLAARGAALGASPVEREKLALARTLLEKALARGIDIMLPDDIVVAPSGAAGASTSVAVNEIPAGAFALDIGPRAATRFAAVLGAAKTILWTGVLHAAPSAPSSSPGTAQLIDAFSDATAFKLVLGADVAAVVGDAPPRAGALHVSRGGGAALALLQGQRLPGLEALRDPQFGRSA